MPARASCFNADIITALKNAVRAWRKADLECTVKWTAWQDRAKRYRPEMASEVASMWLDAAAAVNLEVHEHKSRASLRTFTSPLVNLTNTCYQNVIIQVLAHCPPVLHALGRTLAKPNKTVTELISTIGMVWQPRKNYQCLLQTLERIWDD